MLKKNTPKTIAVTLSLIAMGETIKLPVVYRNLKPAEYDQLVDASVKAADGDKERQNALVVLGLLESWEAEYDLDVEGLIEAEQDRPYTIMALLGGFFEARQVQRVKN